MLDRWRQGVSPWRYPFAMLAIAIAFGLRWLLDDLLAGYNFITFYPAIFATALLAGWKAGFLALLLSLALVWSVLIPPAFSFALSTEVAVPFAAFVLLSGMLLWVAALLEREAEDRRAAAERSDLLFRELKHRVSNVLQLCAGLLRLRAEQLPAQHRHVLTEAAQHLVAMQRIHDRIAGAGDSVPLEPTLRELCDAVAPLAPGLRSEIRCEDVSLTRDHVIPIALALHELLNNVAEHGCAADGSGAVALEARRVEGDGWCIIVMAEGSGLPQGFTIDGAPRQGLKIVRSLAAQAGATFTLQNRKGGNGVRAELVRPAGIGG